MKNYNIIVVYNKSGNKILMCKRTYEPFKGQLNLVGGLIEENEDGLTAAYRELNEETGISSEDIHLKHFMDFKYHYYDISLEVYVGQLNKEVKLVEEVNKLLWVLETEDFYNKNYAGDGNISHIIKQIEYEKEKILKE